MRTEGMFAPGWSVLTGSTAFRRPAGRITLAAHFGNGDGHAGGFWAGTVHSGGGEGLAAMRLRLLWSLLSRSERDLLSELLPAADGQAVRRLLRGKALYEPCFDRHRCIFVHIPKSAGSSVAQGLFGQRTVGHFPIRWHQTADPVRFADYFKFGFVRNPWDRLLSAYLYLQRGGAAKRDQGWSDFVRRFDSFDDFVRQWLNEENAQRSVLFLPQYRFVCDRFGMPCLDLIGRYENLQRDYQQIAARLGVTAQLPSINRSPDRQAYTEHYSARSRELVARVYARDIELFGYRFDGPLD